MYLLTKRFSLLMASLALMASLFAAAPMAQGDFAEGFTGLGNQPVGVADSEWIKRQAEALKAAEEALKAAPQTTGQTRASAPGELAAGDKIRLTVYGEEELSGEFEVAGNGTLSIPLAGDIQASGLTANALERAIEKELSAGYLVNPRVSVQVLSFRPFFILGEVNKPGSYPWSNGMTVINAVALGGGYTPRAKTGTILLRRVNDPERREERVPEDTAISPGDIVRVEERFF